MIIIKVGWGKESFKEQIQFDSTYNPRKKINSK